MSGSDIAGAACTRRSAAIPVLGEPPLPIVSAARIVRRRFVRTAELAPPVPMWVITCRPSDYPDAYVVRRHDVYADGQLPLPGVVCAGSLEEARRAIPGFCIGMRVQMMMPRATDPVVAETWF